ncbi:MAG: polysaccharide biosynthesis/export family protein [Thermodesulfobacteriota bacterium]|nr:polysaccharide biosynthesis/export family protein [Thermodesulfobacteriota bacterium]
MRTAIHENFTRIVFEFQNTVQFKNPEIIGKGKFSVLFLDSSTDLPPVTAYEKDSLRKVQSVEFIKNKSNLTANVTLSFPDFTLKAFSLSNPDCIIVDAYRVSDLSKDSLPDTSLNDGASSEVSKQPETKEEVTVSEKSPTTETDKPSIEPLSVRKSVQNGPKPSAKTKEEETVIPNVPNLSQIQEISPGPHYVIGTGDVLFVSVWKDEALTNQVAVLPDGTIAFPLIGEIQAAGKTVAALKAELEGKLKHYLPDPTLTVMVQQMNSMQIYIIGRVNRSGSYPLHTQLNVLQALSIAGGLNPFADRKKIKIFRDNGDEKTIHRFNYDDVTKEEKLDQNIALKRGDTIVVP